MNTKWRRYKRQFKQMLKKTFWWGLIVCLVMFVGIWLFSTERHGSAALFEQNNMSEQRNFIDSLTPKAKALQSQYGIFPSVVIAQAILESDWGRSDLAKESNNLFGIKDRGEGKNYWTKEHTADGWVDVTASFQIYDSLEASMDDYADLMVNGTSWNPSLYHPVLSSANYIEAAEALQSSGYATDPSYSDKIIAIIETYELYELDQEILEDSE